MSDAEAPRSSLVLYFSEDGRARIRCRLEGDTTWLTEARRKQQVFLRDWQQKLDEFLRFNERDVLPNAGPVSRKQADDEATAEYEGFGARRRAAAELQGEADAFRALEDAANRRPEPTKGRASKRGGE